ncbi:Fructosamine/Ketosamine-3-kinase [Cynara cardunculus var. scolymus]|uniref:Protein-ribulosamine 3-kinase, chloroplastic n=1 Tax=Cynara cardunculus var. scolymus TaxID=59895 RepID=A0A103XED0_CYNCS|nr:Fructosamine/Ketosamine-3-kinase [Cynara cardunculus var. scolymus]
MVAQLGVISSTSSCHLFRSSHPFSIRLQKPMAMATVSTDPVREWILSEGKASQITGISPVGGGCINLASRYNTDAGSFFVKTNRSIGPEMFEGEALGLRAMYETKSIRVPQPFKVGALPTGGSYIIMEFIEFGSSRGDQSLLGRKLAEMHKATKSENGQRLVKNLGALFEDVTIEPCLLHGDLWSGNISSDKNGEPMDIMKQNSECHGVPVSEARSTMPILRRDVYLLYHYLNHYNLFGSGYRSSAMSIIDDYLRMLKA